jgi:hypothetical protein
MTPDPAKTHREEETQRYCTEESQGPSSTGIDPVADLRIDRCLTDPQQAAGLAETTEGLQSNVSEVVEGEQGPGARRLSFAVRSVL